MADIKISELAEATSLSDSDVLAGVNASTTRKFSLARLKSFFFSALTKADVGLGNVANVLQYSADNKPTPSEIGAVPETRTINGKALAQDVTLDASDVGVSISTSTPNMDGVGAAGSTGDVSDAGHTHPSDTSKANETELAYVETGSTASRAYAVGEYFCWNGLLYRVTSAISSGASFTVGTNCEQVTGGGLNSLKSQILLSTTSNKKAKMVVESANGACDIQLLRDGTVTASYPNIYVEFRASDGQIRIYADAGNGYSLVRTI